MAKDFGPGVSYVIDDQGYNYDTVVFQKGKPPLDSELNLVQELGNDLRTRQRVDLPSGWLSYYPVYTQNSYINNFYTQNPTGAKPEYALVNGHVLLVTDTATQEKNANIVQLEAPPASGNVVDGVILEMWRALLSPNSSTHKPDPATVIDTLRGIYMYGDGNNGWICGDNGLLIGTQNGGQTWSILPIDTKYNLNSIFFSTQNIGWVVGNNGTIFRTSSAGVRWTPLASGRVENLNSIHAFSQLIAWAAGDSGLILKTTNSINWSPLVSGTTKNLKKVHFYNQLIGWVVGESGTILKTTNGGTTWIPQVSGTTETLNSIYFYNDNYGFAVGNSGTILKTATGGASWVSQTGSATSKNLFDITMVPSLDRATAEEVSSQVVPSGTSFTVTHRPMTVGDGNGTVLIDPNDTCPAGPSLRVTVDKHDGNGPVAALVDSVNGNSGIVILNEAPGYNATVMVSYYYKEDCAVFEGKAWVVGAEGVIYFTDNIGASWTLRDSGVAYDLLSIDFINQTTGWLCGENSVIRTTADAGITWTAQQSDIFSRLEQRVFNEGNTETKTYLIDNSIHPDTNIETSKRVQIQYRIRTVAGVDPASNPEAGLSSSIYGWGPNDSGAYGYENMGAINGDYGCWRAKCLDTVDGYVYAIPMFFVSRRNSSAYDPATNPNGSNRKNTNFIRPDLLVSTNVVGLDILDVRRRIVEPSALEFLSINFDDLMANNFKTQLARLGDGGDRYGTELLQVDHIGAGTGGTLISDVSLTQVVNGELTSEIVIENIPYTVTATYVAQSPWSHTLTTGLFHMQPARFKATYVASASSPYNDKPIPGEFSGFGTKTITFTFSDLTATKTDDPNISGYKMSADYYDNSSASLTRVPSEPKLVKNTGSGGTFFYQGVLDTEEYRVIETWASDVPGYQNSARVYPSKEATDIEQTYRASPVEVHYFMKVVSPTNWDGTILLVPSVIKPDPDDVEYTILSINKINNITAGFSHRLAITTIPVSGGNISVTPVNGYEFTEGVVLEIIGMVTSTSGNSSVRNGAAVNFNPNLKSIYNFTKSYTFSGTSLVINIPNTEILGCATTEAASGLNQFIYWKNGVLSFPTSITGFGTDEITITGTVSGTDEITTQLLVRETVLPYPSTADGLYIAYNFIPPQSTSSLPTTLTVDPVVVPSTMYVSNLGSGGGTAGEPYLTPLQHIPTNDTAITTDNIFNNLEPLQFNNFVIDSGFAQLTPYIPGSFARGITFSGPSVDSLSRAYYSTASKEVTFTCEGLQISVPRKVFIPIIARIKDPTNTVFMNGEYVIVILSRSIITDKENKTGYFSGGNSAIAVYKLPNRPMSRI